MAAKINVDTITNASTRKKLGLAGTSEHYFEIPPLGVLVCYFGEFSISAKAYRKRDAPHPLFHEIAKFLLEVGVKVGVKSIFARRKRP